MSIKALSWVLVSFIVGGVLGYAGLLLVLIWPVEGITISNLGVLAIVLVC